MNLIYVDEVVVMTVDGFAYHPHHHHPHPHPHQSPLHQQETFHFFHFPFSIFLLPLLYFTFFHLGELGQPNHVQFRVTVNCDDGHILLFLYPSQSLSRAAAKQKSFTSGKEKSQIFVQFPVCHPSHRCTRVGMSTERKEYCGRDNRSFLGGRLNWFFLFFIFSCCQWVSCFCNFHRQKKERQKEGAGIILPPSRECTGTSIQYLQEA